MSVAAEHVGGERTGSRAVGRTFSHADLIREPAFQHFRRQDQGGRTGKVPEVVVRFPRDIGNRRIGAPGMSPFHWTMNDAQFPGAYREMGRKLNQMVKAHIEVQTQFMDCMVQYANGRFETRMPPLPGERRAISDTAERLRGALLQARGRQGDAANKDRAR